MIATPRPPKKKNKKKPITISMSDFPHKLLTSAFSLLCKCKEQTDLRIKTNETEL
jgi:hypothetical protein